MYKIFKIVLMHKILWISTFAQQNIMYLHIYTNCAVFYTTFKKLWRFIKYCALHKLHCIVHKNIVNLYNYTNCIVLYTNCKIYARRVVRIMSIILWMHLTCQYVNYILNVKYFAQIILHRNKVKLLWMYITPQNEVNIHILKIQVHRVVLI